MRNWTGLKTIEENKSKIISMNWQYKKNVQSIFILVLSLIFILSILNADAVTINDEVKTMNSFKDRILPLVIVLAFIIPLNLIFFLGFYPYKVILEKDSKGDITITKTEQFFKVKKHIVKASEKPTFIIEKKRIPLYILPHYVLKLKSTKNKEDIEVVYVLQEFGLIWIHRLAYSVPKDKIQEISKFLDIKIHSEE